ncbi:hypothetical protein K8T06_14690 [bacterium]|nr:hypothetical protein [bacterium]
METNKIHDQIPLIRDLKGKNYLDDIGFGYVTCAGYLNDFSKDLITLFIRDKSKMPEKTGTQRKVA